MSKQNRRGTSNPASRGLLRGTKGTVEMTGLTEKQLDWCNNVLEGQNRTQAARNAYPDSVKTTVAGLAVRNWRNKNCQRYLEDQILTTSAVNRSVLKVIAMHEATKTVNIEGEATEVPDNPIQLKAALEFIKLQREMSQGSAADPEGAFEDTFWTDWYKQESGVTPTPEQLAAFKSKNITVEAEEVQERLFSSKPEIKGYVPLDPATYVEE